MENKKWYKSKTIWGLIIAALGYFLSHVLQVPEVSVPKDATFDDLQKYAEQIKAANGSLEVLVANLMGIVGVLIAFFGRVKADTKITA